MLARRRTASRPPARSSPRSSPRSRIVPIALAAAIVAALAYAGVVEGRRRIAAGRLPAVPDTALSAAIRDHLTSKYEIAEREPRSSTAVGALCMAFHADLLYEQAERCYEQAVQLAGSDWHLSYLRAILESERGRSEPLAASLRQVLTQAADFSPAWLRLGDVEFKTGHYDRAEEAWNHAIAASEPPRSASEPPTHVADIPVSAYASLGLARIALARSDADRARGILEPVTVRVPRFGPSFRLLAESYSALGRQADADRAMQRANRLPPFAPYADPVVDELVRESRSSTYLLRQASDADLKSNAEWSEFLTRRALMFDPENPEVVAKLGRLLRTLGRSGDALEYLTQYTRMVPGDFQGIGQLGSCLSDLGRYDDAEPLIRQALAGLDDAMSHYNLGALLSATGRFDEAVAEYRRALDRDPMDSDARSNLAAVLVRQGKLAAASQELARTLAIDPENANAHTNFGLLLAREGQMARAAEEFRAALRLNPGQRQASEALRELGR